MSKNTVKCFHSTYLATTMAWWFLAFLYPKEDLRVNSGVDILKYIGNKVTGFELK
jgi:hypothetical protein